MNDTPIDLGKPALVLIDLQDGIIVRETAPHSSAKVVERSAQLAAAFRERRLPVVIVTVGWSPDMADAPHQTLAPPIAAPDDPDAFVAVAPELDMQPGDIPIRKRQWGAFYGTELDLQLRRRGIDTIVLAGIATNMGVESTARSAWEHGYSLALVEDATTSFGEAMHRFAFDTIFPRLGAVRSTDEILAILPTAAAA